MFTQHRTDFHGAVLLALGPTRTPAARWTVSAIPTLENAALLLQPILQTHCTHWRLALTDDIDGSPLDLPTTAQSWSA
jgi:hypothetical protein